MASASLWTAARAGVPLALCVVAVGSALSACTEDRPASRAPTTDIPRPASERGGAHHFDVEPVASGLDRPTWVGTAPGDAALWVLEQPGRVVRLAGERRQVALDLSARVRTGGEQGLLGVAFHPQFASNRLLYLHYSDRAGNTNVAEFRVNATGTAISPRPLRTLLRVEQPEENHNGGQLAFGPDGRLYLGLGDGGGAFDPRRTAQDPDNLLGKLVAADVREQRPRWEVVLTGLRNPWRFSFDSALSEVWVSDVGQDRTEEVNRVPLELDEPPKNLGWSAYEGTQPVPRGDRLRKRTEVVWPVATYSHDDGCSVIGGVVYAGTEIASLTRRYVFGDFCSGTLWTLRGTPGGRATDMRREQATAPQVTHIGTDGEGELLLASATGTIYRAVEAGP